MPNDDAKQLSIGVSTNVSPLYWPLLRAVLKKRSLDC